MNWNDVTRTVMEDYGPALAEQMAAPDPIFFSGTRTEHYGPDTPWLAIGDLQVEWSKAGLTFLTPGWESEPAFLSWEQVGALEQWMQRMAPVELD